MRNDRITPAPCQLWYSPNGRCKVRAIASSVTTNPMAHSQRIQSGDVGSGHVDGIQATAVSKRFDTVDALSPVDLTIARGEVVTVLGPSGCGKTTLLRMIAGLEPTTTGTITIDGESPDSANRRKRFGLVPQSPALLPWRTVEANARLLQDINPGANHHPLSDVVDLLERVGLADFRDALPHKLSGGMQQRVSLVRAFAIDAPYLLMDEPFAALDEITRADMRHLLATLSEPTNTGVLFVTHSLAEAVYLSDRVVVLSSRPGYVVGTVEVDLPRPRVPAVEDDPAFFAIETRLRHLLHQGAGR